MPRFRFAPSPTGYLHIGGARTALFNWLLARQQKGEFVLRIEDTDRERSTEESTNAILESLKWLGLDWDNELVFQSQRTALYKEHIERLLKEGKAYKCFCTPDELKERRDALMAAGKKPKYDGKCRATDQNQNKPFCVRFISEDVGTTVVDDLIQGKVSFQNEELDDLVLQRTDGSPTYNLVVVIDDHEMKLTHVIRGNDHLNNTPRQIQLYKAFGWTPPQFGHVALILGADKSRLSKRHGATSVLQYKEEGFLPEALNNFLVRIGWSHGDEEIFSMEELKEKFDLKHVGKASGVFNPEKLLWLNAHYIKNKSNKELVSLTKPFFEKEGIHLTDEAYAEKVLGSLKEKAKKLTEFPEQSRYFFTDEIQADPKAAEQWLTEKHRGMLKQLHDKLTTLTDWTEGPLKEAFESVLAANNEKMKSLAQPVRVALTGNTISPGIFDLMMILGREKTIRRLQKIIV